MDSTFSQSETNSSNDFKSLNKAKSSSLHSKSSFGRASKLNWTGLVALLRQDPGSKQALITHFDLLSVSTARFERAKNVDLRFRQIVADFGTQNCVRALSVLEDCSRVKKNQYKWMYEGFSLGTAIEMLVRESRYLFKSLGRKEEEMQHFARLVNNWVDYLGAVHRIPRDAGVQLRRLIIERIGLLLGVALVQ